MTLLERTQTIASLLKKRQERDVRNGVATRLFDRTRKLQEHLTTLETARARADALRAAGRTSRSWAAFSPAPLAAYYAPGTPPVTVETEAKDAWESFILALGGHVKGAITAVSQDIIAAKSDALQCTSLAELDDFAGDPGAADEARRLRVDLVALQQASWERLSPEELKNLLAKADRLCVSVKRLRENGASEELRRFLQQAARPEGASLDAFSEPVRAELATRGLLARVRLVIK